MDTLISTKSSAQRHYHIDWLRVLAFMLLVPFHVGMFFNTWGFHFKNAQTSESFEVWMIFLSQWRLPLLFLVSGMGVAFALRNRSIREFVRERFNRLFIPLLVGIFVIVPPQIFTERLTKGATFSYWEFYQTVFQFVPYPSGNFSWHHLWFILYIFVFSLLCIPLFRWLRSEQGKYRLERIQVFLSHPAAMLLLMILPWIEAAILAPLFPVTHNLVYDWYNVTVSITVFFYGYCIASMPKLLENIESQRKIWLITAVGCVSILYPVYWLDWPDPSAMGIVLYRFIKFLNIWAWLLTFIGYSRKYLNFTNRFLQYANTAVYPFYILHQSIQLVLGYYILYWPMDAVTKFFILIAATYLVSGLLYECIRRISFLHPFFGLKSTPKPVSLSAVASPQVS